MLLRSLILKNFRNYSSLNISFSEGVNLIVGDNGMGKTNLLEAINLLSTGRSFKTNQLQDLIKDGQSYFYIQAIFIKEGVTQTLKIGYSKTHKVLEYNSNKFSALSNILGILPSTLYSPKDLAIVTGTPSDRRKFINILLAQSDPLYVHHLLRYIKALKQRNALLKMKKLLGIESFEHELAISGLYLSQLRKQTLEDLESKLTPFIEKFSQNQDFFNLKYLSSINMQAEKLKENFLQNLKKMRNKEMSLSTTLIGPHRDDIGIFHNEKSAKLFASEGQKRTFITGLKYSEWLLMKEKHNVSPLFCVDDFGEHFDETRKTQFEHLLKSFGQVFLTMPKNTLSLSPQSLFHIKDGKLNIV